MFNKKRSKEIKLKLLTNEEINFFISEMEQMKSINANFLHASQRKQAHTRFNLSLEGVDTLGRVINAKLCCDISCKWNRSTAPIYINGKKSNIRGLKKSL